MIDENIKQPKQRIFTRLGYKPMETVEIVEAMNGLLANYSVHYQNLRNFHWNVKGAEFFDVHEKFEDQYNAAKVAIDDIAERIRVFNQTPLSRMSDYLKVSDIEEADTELEAMDMVKYIVKDYEILLEHLFNVVEVAIENGDIGTEDLVKGLIRDVEKNHWMMSSFIQ